MDQKAENIMKLEVLMSAMHQKDFSIAYRSKIDSDLLIINQCDENRYDEIEVNGHTWRMISTTERGASRSRNMALDNARGDICLLADDDEELTDGYADHIMRAYETLPDATAIAFNLNRINYSMKKTYYRIEKIRVAPLYRNYGNPMFSFCLVDIKQHNIRFNEKFGSGTPWGGGEDSLFQDDIRKKKMKIYEHPFEIATIDYSCGSSWFHGYTEKYFYNLGAFLAYKYKYNFLPKTLRTVYICFYKLRKDKTLTPFQRMKWVRLGEKGIKKNITYAEYKEGKK